MQWFVKIVLTGFGLALGGAVFKKAAPYLGLDDDKKKTESEKRDEEIRQGDGATDPGLEARLT